MAELEGVGGRSCVLLIEVFFDSKLSKMTERYPVGRDQISCGDGLYITWKLHVDTLASQLVFILLFLANRHPTACDTDFHVSLLNVDHEHKRMDDRGDVQLDRVIIQKVRLVLSLKRQQRNGFTQCFCVDWGRTTGIMGLERVGRSS